MCVLCCVALRCLLAAPGGRAAAQALPAATVPFAVGVSGGAAMRATGVGGAINLDAQLGAEVDLHPLGGWLPAVVGQVSRPVVRGSVAGEREALGGLRLARSVLSGAAARQRLVFGELMAGEGEIRYLGKGMAAAQPPYFYTLSHSVVWAAGGGLEQAVNVQRGAQRAVRVRVQLERWQTPVTASGHTFAASVGVEWVWRPSLGGVR